MTEPENAWYEDPDVLYRFFAKVERTDSGCWEWTAWIKEGYGRFALERGNYPYAHCVSYRINIGPIPTHLQINHHCDSRSCVNPAHLYAGTIQDNIDDTYLAERTGEDAWTSKVTEAEVREIRQQYDTGTYTHRSLAAEHNVSHTTIGEIVRGERWSHVEVEK